MRDGQTLLIDADDTLWENGVYFVRATEAFLDLLAGFGHAREATRRCLDDHERQRVHVTGYGVTPFGGSLHATAARLLDGAGVPREARERIDAIIAALMSHPVELLPGVGETLEALGVRHRLILVTKGREQEQRRKIEASGLVPRFHAVEILPRKDQPAYEGLVARHGADKAHTWMIGNSPRSDVNPAVAAGLGAVHIPHPVTWALEEEPLARSDRLLVLNSFLELRAHF